MSTELCPLAFEIPYEDPVQMFSRFAVMPGAIFFDSARRETIQGRYSFIALDPFSLLQVKNGSLVWDKVQQNNVHPFKVIQDALKPYHLTPIPDLPPFQGGVAGFFSYDLCHALENLPEAKADDAGLPDLILGFYDLIISFDHQQQKAWIVASGLPESDAAKRRARAESRGQWLKEKLAEPFAPPADAKAVCDKVDIHSNFQYQDYLAAVEKVIEYIYAGDIFEANISQRFSTNLVDGLSAWHLYLRLRNLNPAPFAAYLNFNEVILASASPERFLQLKRKVIEARPIKGTRPRGSTVAEDQDLADALRTSLKDRAENIMIVDLLRNDLSKVCLPHSVKVQQLCALESYATVHHLVSAIEGTLKPELDALDLLLAAFPGGSITGAPKVRAMEIIAEIEPTVRGPYCGSIAYIGFDGAMDSSIIIRTFLIKDQRVSFQVGGAIVADSDPLAEYQETLSKAKALLQALSEVQ